MRSSPDLRLITIPTTDGAFREHVIRLSRAIEFASPVAFERRLRSLFPRAVVREREIANEPPAWYVYRDGSWSSSLTGPWWNEPGLPRIAVSTDGWIVESSPSARSLLGIAADDASDHHFTDFVAPGTLEDSLALFRVVEQGHELTATVVLRPVSAEVLAVDVHIEREADRLVTVFRLAGDILPAGASTPLPRPSRLDCHPAGDAAFAAYVRRALDRMPEATIDGLALRLHRLYPHASVSEDASGAWVVERDRDSVRTPEPAWWDDPALPRVRYDAQALILEANEAARSLLGSALVGHHWQEFVTPGSADEVAAMLEILATVGGAESRFRMPDAGGSLVEFDSYTSVEGETFTTVMRPRAVPVGAA